MDGEPRQVRLHGGLAPVARRALGVVAGLIVLVSFAPWWTSVEPVADNPLWTRDSANVWWSSTPWSEAVVLAVIAALVTYWLLPRLAGPPATWVLTLSALAVLGVGVQRAVHQWHLSYGLKVERTYSTVAIYDAKDAPPIRASVTRNELYAEGGGPDHAAWGAYLGSGLITAELVLIPIAAITADRQRRSSG